MVNTIYPTVHDTCPDLSLVHSDPGPTISGEDSTRMCIWAGRIHSSTNTVMGIYCRARIIAKLMSSRRKDSYCSKQELHNEILAVQGRARTRVSLVKPDTHLSATTVMPSEGETIWSACRHGALRRMTRAVKTRQTEGVMMMVNGIDRGRDVSLRD